MTMEYEDFLGATADLVCTRVEEYGNRANASMALDRHDEALRDYDKACNPEPDEPSFLLNRSGLLLELGMREHALEDLKKARQLSGNGDMANPRDLIYIARMFLRCNEPDLAEESLLAFLRFVLSVLPYAAREEDDAGIGHIIRKDGLAIQMRPGIIEPDDFDSFANIIVNENGGKNASRFERLLNEVRQGIQALGNIKDPRHIEPLIGMLDDISPYVRCTAAWALGLIGDSRMVEPLVRTPHDANAEVRYQTASAFGKAQDSRSVKHLIPMLEDDDSNVRSCAARILAWKTRNYQNRLLPLYRVSTNAPGKTRSKTANQKGSFSGLHLVTHDSNSYVKVALNTA